MDRNKARLLVSYAASDRKYKTTLLRHLRRLQRTYSFEIILREQPLLAAADDNSVNENISDSEIIILLISPEFLGQDYYSQEQISEAIYQYEQGNAVLVPVLVRPTYILNLRSITVGALPRQSQAISEWENESEAWAEVIETVEVILGGIEKGVLNLASLTTDKRSKSISQSRINESDLERYRKMVEQNEIEEVYRELIDKIEHTDREILDELVVLTSQLRSFKKQETEGALKGNTADKVRSFINQSLLDLLDRLEQRSAA